jgi:hypothetical protein
VNASAAAALVFVAVLLAALTAAIVAILRRGRQRPRAAHTPSPASRALKRRALLMMMPGFVVIGSAAIVSFTGHPAVGLVIFVGYAFLVATLTVITGIFVGRRSRS